MQAAREAFTSGDDNVSLEGVARAAGVGIGTLYRHFPSREALVDAVYRAEFDDFCADLDHIRASQPPDQALRSLMHRFADYLATKRELLDTLRTKPSAGQVSLAMKRTILIGKIDELLARGESLRHDVSGEDVFTALVGIFSACPLPEQRDQADRLISLLLDGLRS